MKFLHVLLHAIDQVNEWTGRILALSIFAMFLLVLSEVIRRYFFNAPTVWGTEATQLIFGAYVILSGGHILKSNGHVNVDILYSRLSTRSKAVLDIITYVVFLLFCGMLFIYGGQLAWESLVTWERSQSAWNPPVYPFKLMIPLGALLLILQGTAKLIRDILVLVTGESSDRHASKERETL